MDKSNDDSSNQNISSLTKSNTKDKPTNSSINYQSTKDNLYDDETDEDVDNDEIFNNEKEKVKGFTYNFYLLIS